MRARFYNPCIRRFINSDPIGSGGGMNFYAYADGNPISFIDPFGLGAQGTEGWGGTTASWINRNLVGQLDSISTGSTIVNYYSYMAGSMIGGMGDLLRVGQGSANAAYNSQNGWDVAIGVSQDISRTAGIAGLLGSLGLRFAPTAAKQVSLLPVAYDAEFASSQLLGTRPFTPGGRQIMPHAADRMVNPPPGRGPMNMFEVDQVLDAANKIRKVDSLHPKGPTVTIQNTRMPGKPQVIVDAATGKRVVTVVQPKR